VSDLAVSCDFAEIVSNNNNRGKNTFINNNFEVSPMAEISLHRNLNHEPYMTIQHVRVLQRVRIKFIQ
jgi:hypothetical protein